MCANHLVPSSTLEVALAPHGDHQACASVALRIGAWQSEGVEGEKPLCSVHRSYLLFSSVCSGRTFANLLAWATIGNVHQKKAHSYHAIKASCPGSETHDERYAASEGVIGTVIHLQIQAEMDEFNDLVASGLTQVLPPSIRSRSTWRSSSKVGHSLPGFLRLHFLDSPFGGR